MPAFLPISDELIMFFFQFFVWFYYEGEYTANILGGTYYVSVLVLFFFFNVIAFRYTILVLKVVLILLVERETKARHASS